MEINHKTLAITSGVALVIIIGINIVSLPKSEQTQETLGENTISETETSNEEHVEAIKETYSDATIDLSGKGLTEVPGVVFKRSNIEVLDISNNNLQGALQAEIRHMDSLRVLDISHNMFTGVPAEVGQLQNLEVLDLSNNKITGLPNEIGNLKKLKTLDLRGNDYSTLDLETIKKGLPESTVILTD